MNSSSSLSSHTEQGRQHQMVVHEKPNDFWPKEDLAMRRLIGVHVHVCISRLVILSLKIKRNNWSTFTMYWGIYNLQLFGKITFLRYRKRNTSQLFVITLWMGYTIVVNLYYWMDGTWECIVWLSQALIHHFNSFVWVQRGEPLVNQLIFIPSLYI